MARLRPMDSLSTSRRYRIARRADGLKLVRLWVPDPRSPGFADEGRRQAQSLIGAPEEADALDFIEQTADWDSADQ